MNNSSGIYLIRNKVNGKIYIGSASNFRTRWNDHKFYLRKGRHHCPHLQAAWNKYGETAFELEILITCDKSLLKWYEQQFIDQWKPEYNATNKAIGFDVGHDVPDEWRQRFSDAAKQQGGIPEWSRRKNSIDFRGVNNPAGHKLTESEVMHIKELLGVMPQRYIAEAFGVSQRLVVFIKQGRKWASVGGV